MADPELTRILAELVKTNASRQLPKMGEVTGLSKAILSNVGVQNPYKSGAVEQKDVRGPSVVNRVLDVMSRPLYSVLNPLKDEFEENKSKIESGDYMGAIKGGANLLSPITNLDSMWEGLAGREKTTGRDILESSGAGEHLNGPGKFAAGLALDIGLDPLTYVGGIGLASKIGGSARKSTEALKNVEDATGRSAQTIAEQISQKAAKQASDLDVIVPKPGMPAPAPGSPPRTFIGDPGPPGGLEAFSAGQKSKIIEGVSTPNPSTPMRALPAPPAPARLDPIRVDFSARIAEDLETIKFIKEQISLTKDPATIKELTERVKKMEAEVKAAEAGGLAKVKKLNDQISKAKSPVAKNILRKEVEKIRAGVAPADVFTAARQAPTPFPDITINPRWAVAAKEVAEKFMKNNRLKDINHVGQTNLYNSILNAASKVRKDRRAFHVFQMLRVAENHITNAGRVLTDAEGVSVRLSDVANMMGGPSALSSRLVDDFRKARPSQWVENVKAFTTPQVASEILDPVVRTAADLAPELGKLPPSQTVMVGSDISKALTRLAKTAGASAVEAKTAKAFIDDLFSVDRDKLYSAIDAEARNLVRQSSSGVIDPAMLARISDETYKSLGVNPKVLGKEMTQSKVVEGVMTKFATWWGAKDLKPFSREYIDTARNVAAAFSETMRPLVRNTTATQRKAAWSVAGGKRLASSPEEQALADQFRYMVERLMGTHGIVNNAEAVVLRSGTILKELNDELPKALQFVGTRGADALGRPYDYTKGNWMHSWKEWDIDEPAEALYQLTRSLQMVTRKNAMWDDAAARWGLPKKTGEYQHQAAGVDRLRGTYFPKEIATQISNLQRQLTRDVFKSNNKALQVFDQVQRMWKTGVTIYSPSHHIRNLNGDVYLAALDGVVSPRPYAIATKVLHAFPSRYKSMESVFNIMDPNLRESALRARPGNIVLTTKHGDKVTAEQIYQAAESQGLFIRAMHVEDIMGDTAPAFGSFGAKFQPFGGRVNQVATQVSEMRDHWVRLAHFIDVLGKSKQPLPVAIEAAARRVRKFHPDGMDLTGFEQNVMRRIIPFYSWMRKATPLVFEGAIMRPHITLAFPKAMANLQLATGVESQGPGDPFPMDQMFPEWLKEKGVGPILQPGSGIGRDETWRGEAPGYTIINPTNPFTDQVAMAASPMKTALSSLTPGARIPIELLTGSNALGIPLENVEGGVPGHLAQQIPAVGIGARLTGMTRDNEPWQPEQLINFMTGMGVTGTGPYQSQAQTEIRELLRKIGEQNRGDYR